MEKVDKSAVVRYLIDQFNSNCKTYYSLSQNVTVDEILDENTAITIERKLFLTNIDKGLLENHLCLRIQQANLPTTIKLHLSEILRLSQNHPALPAMAYTAQGRCFQCHRKKNWPTRFQCIGCHQYICLVEHVKCNVCGNCVEKINFVNVKEDDSDE